MMTLELSAVVGAEVVVVAVGTIVSGFPMSFTTEGDSVTAFGTIVSPTLIPDESVAAAEVTQTGITVCIQFSVSAQVGAVVVVVAAGMVVTEISELTDSSGEDVTVEAVGITVSVTSMFLVNAAVVVVAVGVTVSRTPKEGDIPVEDVVALGVTL